MIIQYRQNSSNYYCTLSDFQLSVKVHVLSSPKTASRTVFLISPVVGISITEGTNSNELNYGPVFTFHIWQSKVINTENWVKYTRTNFWLVQNHIQSHQITRKFFLTLNYRDKSSYHCLQVHQKTVILNPLGFIFPRPKLVLRDNSVSSIEWI